MNHTTLRLHKIPLEIQKILEYTTFYFLRNNLLSHENIGKAIHLAFDHTYKFTLLFALDIQVALKRKKKITLHQVSSFVRSRFKRETNKSPSDDIRCDSSEEESIDRLEAVDDPSTESSKDNSIGENTSDTSSCVGNSKSSFHGMRAFDSIPTSLETTETRTKRNESRLGFDLM